MEQSVKDVIDKLSLPFRNDLIQNTAPMAFSQSLENPLIILRWRNRVCDSCSTSFDIHAEGRFYKCGGCLI